MKLPVWFAYAIERLPLISSFYEIEYEIDGRDCYGSLGGDHVALTFFAIKMAGSSTAPHLPCRLTFSNEFNQLMHIC